MKVVVDSGGTKTAWYILEGNATEPTFVGSGINLNVQNRETVRAQLWGEWHPEYNAQNVTELHFYGAGLGAADNRVVMAALLKEIFSNANVNVETDLLGAARATCGHRPGVVCILGTGSNACRYDGAHIASRLGGHGWVLGDEGSGADLGKSLLKAALDGELPQNTILALEEWRGQTLMALRTDFYASERPNAILASLAPFYGIRENDSVLRGIMMSRFRLFLEKTVLRWDEHGEVHFLGGIAAAFAPQVRMVCAQLGITPGNIIPTPGIGLIEYHR